jgi:hypothetical protein
MAWPEGSDEGVAGLGVDALTVVGVVGGACTVVVVGGACTVVVVTLVAWVVLVGVVLAPVVDGSFHGAGAHLAGACP